MESFRKKSAIEVSAAVIIRQDEVLLTSRDDHGEQIYWEFPGGKREPGESFCHCLRREIREELGLEISVYDVMFCIDHAYPARDVSIRFFRCALPRRQTEIVPREGQQCRWVRVDRLAEAGLLPADAPLAAFLRHHAEACSLPPQV